jgi:hypothetical protein
MTIFKRPSTHYGKRPNPKRPISAPRRSGTSASARPACRRRTGAHGLRLADPVGRLRRRAGLAIGARHRRALGGAGRQARPGAGRRARRRPTIADRSADRLASRPLHRAGPLDPGRSDHRAAELAARLRVHHRSRRGALNDYARANDPFTKVGKQQVAVEVSSVIRASPDSASASPGPSAATRTASSPRPSAGPPS